MKIKHKDKMGQSNEPQCVWRRFLFFKSSHFLH